VISLVLVPADKHPLVAALPGQFVVLRLRPRPDTPLVVRNYSLSDTPSDDHYRVSVKQEANGVASTYVHTQVQVDDVLEVSAPRGTFTFRLGNNPIILLSAGVGATPMLAMLHALAAEASPREVWWLFGARNRDEHPFAQEARRRLQTLPNSRSYIFYSRPGQEDRPGLDFDAPGHLNVTVLKELGVPREADFYLCGPAAFLQDLTSGPVPGDPAGGCGGRLGAVSTRPGVMDGVGPKISVCTCSLVTPQAASPLVRSRRNAGGPHG